MVKMEMADGVPIDKVHILENFNDFPTHKGYFFCIFFEEEERSLLIESTYR